MSAGAIDHSRRAWLRGRPRGHRGPQRPPWAVPAFEQACTRCGACQQACPQRVIKPGDGGFPEIDPARGECTFCAACVDACPEAAFDATIDPPWSWVAAIGDDCLAHAGVHCQSCAESCPEGAITFELRVGSPPRPRLASAACTGCGACVAICPEAAITLVDREPSDACQ